MSYLSFDEIIFLDDFFRSEEIGLQSHPSNRRFLRGLFEFAGQSLGIAMREEYPVSSGGRIPVGLMMDSLGLPRTVEGWASAAIADLQPAFRGCEIGVLGERSLVIGWGMPPSLLNYIASRGASFIDVEVHPLRFSRHLHLGMRTNNRRIARILSKVRIPDEAFQSAAIGMKAMFSRRGDGALLCRDAKVGVFLGQTEVDLALVCDGRLISPTDVMDRVAELAASVDILAIKPHPYQQNTTFLDDLLERVPNAIKIESNIYAMLCAGNIEFFSAISSGALTEAEYFGHRKEALITPDRNNVERLPDGCTEWIPVGSEVASLPVMKDVVRRARVPLFLRPRKRYSAVISSANAEMVDRAFGFRWGLQLDAAGLRSSSKVPLGGDVHFGSGSPHSAGLAAGWHEPEPWGVWSADGAASFLLMLDTTGLPAAGRVQVAVTGTLYQPSGSAPVELDLRINGCTCQFARTGDLLRFFCDLDVQKLRGRPLLDAEILVSGAHRPCDVTESADARRLGFGLHLLRVDVVSVGDGSREAASVEPQDALVE
ncbi:hypothetical protein ABIC33_004281 [Variovorax sp. 1140]|uniref:hypothetical protein n=1 Tax=Variovorax atrisoli TaxID=3394203 RepID=UPI003394ACC1